jgi:hypothetical protein
VRLDVLPWAGGGAVVRNVSRLNRRIHRLRNRWHGGLSAPPAVTSYGGTGGQQDSFLEGAPSKRRWFEEARRVAVIAPGKQEDPVDEWLRAEGITRR